MLKKRIVALESRELMNKGIAMAIQQFPQKAREKLCTSNGRFGVDFQP